ncbi:peptidoglycan-recognition protein LF-like [Euwallacea similis]|uniref:peptidoglycan-recognition protein LF-like n=1 Tax=Euwallacea similis TaxID=1736056 RepID=UPI00344F48C2
MTLSLANSVEDLEQGCSGCNTQSDSDSESLNDFKFTDVKDVKLMTGAPATTTSIVFKDSPYPTVGDTINIHIGKANINGKEFENFTSNNLKIPCENNEAASAPKPPPPTFHLRLRYILVPSIFISILILFAILFIFLNDVLHTKSLRFSPLNPNTTTHIGGHPVYFKANWGGVEDLHSPLSNALPSSLVIISHTATESCVNFTECAICVQKVQAESFKKGHKDIGYNFLIGGDGGIYVGQGWEGLNNVRIDSIGIAFIGDFNKEFASALAVNAGQALIAYGVDEGKVDEGYKLIGENQTSPLRYYSPGWNLTIAIKNWKHYFSGTMLVPSSENIPSFLCSPLSPFSSISSEAFCTPEPSTSLPATSRPISVTCMSRDVGGDTENTNQPQVTNSQATKTKDKEAKNGLDYLKHLLAQRSTQFLFGIILSITTITSLVMFFYFYNFKQGTAGLSTFGHNDNLGDGIQIIHREEWLARPPLNSTKIDHPLSIVRIMHTGGHFCKDYQACVGHVLSLQGWQVGTQGMPDISYNYLIGGDGNVYVGRGAGVENEWMTKAIDVVYIGNFLAPYDNVTDKMDLAGRKLIERLRKEGYLTPDYVVIGQNQTINTQSPGDNVYSRIVKWPHYDPGLYF